MSLLDEKPMVEVMNRTGKSVRDDAYDLWKAEFQQNTSALARYLNVPRTTVYGWEERDKWRERLSEERRDLTLRTNSVIDGLLLRIGPEIIEGLTKIGRGIGDTHVEMDREGNAVDVTNPVPYQARVNAWNSLADRLGIIPVQRSVHSHTLTVAAASLATQTTEELAGLLHARMLPPGIEEDPSSP